MNAVKFLIAAYIATWVIHGFYLVTLMTRFGRAKRELKDLQKEK
jgi:CcmD family protein